MTRIRSDRSRTLTRVGVALLGMSLLGGCMSYTSTAEPGEEGSTFKSANQQQAKRVTSVALGEIIARHPMSDPDGRYSVNLPAGTRMDSALEIVASLPDGAVVPSEGLDAAVPVYHIGRVWVRGSEAKVDVLYPARGFDGSPFEGNATVWLSRGIRDWGVRRVQNWSPGTMEVPDLYIPVEDEETPAAEEIVEPDEPADGGEGDGETGSEPETVHENEDEG